MRGKWSVAPAMAAFLMLAAGPAQAAWRFKEETSRVDGTKSITATRDGGSGSLIIICGPDAAVVSLTYGTRISLFGHRLAPGTHRFNNSQPRNENWLGQGDDALLAGDGARRFIAGLLGADQLFIRIAGAERTLNVSGLGDFADEMRAGCRLPANRPQRRPARPS